MTQIATYRPLAITVWATITVLTWIGCFCVLWYFAVGMGPGYFDERPANESPIPLYAGMAIIAMYALNVLVCAVRLLAFRRGAALFVSDRGVFYRTTVWPLDFGPVVDFQMGRGGTLHLFSDTGRTELMLKAVREDEQTVTDGLRARLGGDVR